MQQSPSDPLPPPAPLGPPAAPAPAATILLPGGPVPLEGLPRTAAEVAGLRARREILRDQLERATNRRNNLANRLEDNMDEAARAGVQQRLTLVDERIIQIEREQAMTERQLSNAPPAVLALASTRAPMNQAGGQVDEDAAAAIAASTFGLGILLTLFAGRFRRRRARREAALAPARGALPADDPRFERLALAVDAIAEEVERIGEGQRFVTQLLAGRGAQAPAIGAGVERGA